LSFDRFTAIPKIKLYSTGHNFRSRNTPTSPCRYCSMLILCFKLALIKARSLLPLAMFSPFDRLLPNIIHSPSPRLFEPRASPFVSRSNVVTCPLCSQHVVPKCRVDLGEVSLLISATALIAQPLFYTHLHPPGLVMNSVICAVLTIDPLKRVKWKGVSAMVITGLHGR
jgi:hypothetical protein